jgi:hypothetical protein
VLKRLAVFCAAALVTFAATSGVPPASANSGGWDIGACAWSGYNAYTGGTYPWYASTYDGSGNCALVGVQFPGFSIAWSGSHFISSSKSGSQPTWTRHHVVSYIDGIQTYRQLSCGC